jgi:hypothetical protein
LAFIASFSTNPLILPGSVFGGQVNGYYVYLDGSHLHSKHETIRRSLWLGASNGCAASWVANRFLSPQGHSSLLDFAVFLAQTKLTYLRRQVYVQFQQLLSHSLLETHSEFCSAHRA